MTGFFLVFLLHGLLDEQAAAARLVEIERAAATAPMTEVEADLRALVEAAPGTAAAGSALIWLGNVAQQAGDPARARAAYERALVGPARGLAARGLGDLAMADERYDEASRRYEQALPELGPRLSAEIVEKREVARERRARARLALAAWGALLVVGAYFLHRARRPPRGSLLELRFVLPIYALFAVAASGRDPEVGYAVRFVALGSLAFLALFGLRAPTQSRRARLGDLVAALSANASIVYLAIHRAHLVDSLLMTLQLRAPP